MAPEHEPDQEESDAAAAKPDGAAAKRKERYARQIERRAEQLGLPTDPEAYIDGGLACAYVAGSVAEADTMAALLKSRGIPAWVDSASSALNSDLRFCVTVLVPAGRLDDAHEAIDEADEGHGATEEGADEEMAAEGVYERSTLQTLGHAFAIGAAVFICLGLALGILALMIGLFWMVLR